MVDTPANNIFGSPDSNCALPGMQSLFGGGQPSTGQQAPPGAGADPPYQCDPERVVLAGGALQQLLVHPSVRPFERRFVRNPLAGIYTATPDATYTFEIGSYTVDAQMSLLITDWKFRVYRFSGVIANETQAIQNGLSTLNIGVDLNVSNQRTGNIMYELLPINPSALQNAFSVRQTGGTIMSPPGINPVPVGAFAPQPQTGIAPPFGSTAQQNAFVAGAGIGSGLMPISDKDHQGPARMPFTYYAHDGQVVQMRVSVYRALGYPVSYFESELNGYLLPTNILRGILDAVTPCVIGARR